jgi:hypothetical protein
MFPGLRSLGGLMAGRLRGHLEDRITGNHRKGKLT